MHKNIVLLTVLALVAMTYTYVRATDVPVSARQPISKATADNLYLHRDGSSGMSNTSIVHNLNANLLGGHESSYYFPVDGGTLVGDITVNKSGLIGSNWRFYDGATFSTLNNSNFEFNAGAGRTMIAGYLYEGSSVYANGYTTTNGLTVHASFLTDTQMVSTLFTGSPFNVASTELNINVNSDLLDGHHATDFVTYNGHNCYAVPYLNSDSTLTQGMVVQIDSATDFSIVRAVSNSIHPIGTIRDSSCARAASCWVCVAGRSPCLLESGTTSTRGYWCSTATTAGYADCDQTDPPSQPVHNQEIGHVAASCSSGALCTCNLHWN